MKIALISFEFPPAVAVGGIGTYAWNAACMLAQAGETVEVFAAGPTGPEPAEALGMKVHRFDVSDRTTLREAIKPVFAARHRARPFDVLESPEIGAEGSAVAAAHPEIARVVKLHTPSYLVAAAGWEPPGVAGHLRFTLGSLRRGRWSVLRPPTYQAESDQECRWTRQADEVAAPSQAIGERVGSDWNLDRDRLSCFPLPFLPAKELSSLPLPSSPAVVGFLGRLEARKGVVEFARAIPRILRLAPALRFRFLGPSWPYRGTDMESWIRQHCRRQMHAIEFVGPVPATRLAEELGKCDVIVLPSRWENFPFACWEAMAAGRAVIGSASGGMAEVIEPGSSGLLVPPHSPEAIAQSVMYLGKHPEHAAALGEAARRRIRTWLAPERILPLQLASYRRAIHRAAKRGGRS